MEIKYCLGCDMNILLQPEDVELLRCMQTIEHRVVDSGLELVTKIIRDPDIFQPVAEVYNNDVNIYLPQSEVSLPAEVMVSRNTNEAVFQFGYMGKVIIAGALKI